jgi:superfamily II DNA or RNA helicase
MADNRFEAEAALAPLKAFQRRTVDYVFDRLYGDQDPVRQFLVADEVGLGKTMVVRGVIARTIEKLWDSTDRIDILYICSNQAIAAQNIKRLIGTYIEDIDPVGADPHDPHSAPGPG